MSEVDFGTRVHLYGALGTVAHFADYYRTQAWVHFDSGSVELVPVEDLRVAVRVDEATVTPIERGTVQ